MKGLNKEWLDDVRIDLRRVKINWMVVGEREEWIPRRALCK